MTTEEQQTRRGISWELVGILAVLAIFLIGFLYSRLTPGAGGGLTPPTEFTLGADLGLETGVTEEGRPYLGSADAPVVFYEFGDFQCASCRDFALKSAAEIKVDYLATGQARLVWVNSPFHGDESDDAARAAICATDQDRFWDLHDWLFANQTALSNSGAFSRDNLIEMAERVGMDQAEFTACMDDPGTQERMLADEDLGAENGVNSTPSFMIGDRLVAGNELDELREVLDSAISE